MVQHSLHRAAFCSFRSFDDWFHFVEIERSLFTGDANDILLGRHKTGELRSEKNPRKEWNLDYKIR